MTPRSRDPRVHAVESLMDSAPWRWTERLVARSRAHRRAIAAPVADQPEPGLRPERRLDQLHRRSAFTDAEPVAQALSASIDAMPPARLAGAAPILVEHWLTIGEPERARDFARRHRRELEATPRGSGLVDLLGLRDALVPWLPDGRPNYLGLTRAIEQRSADPARIVRSIVRRPAAFLRHPQLHLIAYMALRRDDRDAAGRFLGRFFRSQGLPPCRWDAGAPSFLRGVSFPRPAPIEEGPLVSIVMSAFDAEQTVTYAIDSLLAQSHRRLEILVCDDASRDATAALLLRRYGHERRVRLFRSEANQGTYNVRNALLERARGALLTFHDADDVALPDRIAAQVRAMEDADACVTSWLRVTEDGRVVFFRDQNAVRQSVVSLMMSRAVYDAVGPYRQVRFGADLEVLEAVRARFGVRRIRPPLILGLWSDRSLTRSAAAEALEDGYRSPARRVYAELVHLRQGRGADDERVAELERALRTFGAYAEPRAVVSLS